MSRLDPKHVWGLGGIVIGFVFADTVTGGWDSTILLVIGLFGRWLLGKIASTFFDEELKELKSMLSVNDQVKVAIWSHANDNHNGRFTACDHENCQI